MHGNGKIAAKRVEEAQKLEEYSVSPFREENSPPYPRPGVTRRGNPAPAAPVTRRRVKAVVRLKHTDIAMLLLCVVEFYLNFSEFFLINNLSIFILFIIIRTFFALIFNACIV